MEENYGVYFGNRPVGKVQVTRQGLYYHFLCRCELTGDVMCRLWVTCADKRESLGLVVPVDGGFGLNTSLPIKRLGEGELTFSLLPKHDKPAGKFIPISPEEPFAYIERLKQSYLVRKGEQVGKPFPPEQELAAKTARLIELDMELNLDGKGRVQPEQAIAKSARPSVLDRLKAPPVHGAPDKLHKKEMEVR